MKKLLIALLVLGLIAPGMAMAQDLEQRVDRLEENMQEFARQGMKLKETVIGMKKFGFHWMGSFRTHLGYYDVDQEFVPIAPALDGSIGSYGFDDDSGTMLSIAGNSKFGARAILNENFQATVMVGIQSSSRDTYGENKTYLRLAFGEWDFGSGKLMMGQNYTPATFLGYSKMQADIGDTGDGNMLTSGLPYIGRRPLVELSFGDFEFALIEPYTDAQDYQDIYSYYGRKSPYGDSDAFKTDVDFVIPRIEAAHVFRLNDNNLRIRPVAGYQTYDLEVFDTTTGGSDDESIDSFLLGVGVSADFAPAYVKGTATYVQNAGNYGDKNVGNFSTLDVLGDSLLGFSVNILEAQVMADGSIEDSDLMEGTLVAGYKVNDMLNLEAGFGYMNAEVDLPAAVVGALSGSAITESRTAEQTAMTYYAQAWFSLSENASIIPEIGVLDRGDLEVDGLDDIDQGSLTYFDVNFRVDF